MCINEKIFTMQLLSPQTAYLSFFLDSVNELISIT